MEDAFQFLLTRPSRDVTNIPIFFSLQRIISTHTPLAGRDWQYDRGRVAKRISTHTPLAGRDAPAPGRFPRSPLFLLTRPSRDVTGTKTREEILSIISTHTPLAGRDLTAIMRGPPDQDFYSHAPRGT